MKQQCLCVLLSVCIRKGGKKEKVGVPCQELKQSNMLQHVAGAASSQYLKVNSISAGIDPG